MATIDLPEVLAPEAQTAASVPPLSTPELLSEMLRMSEQANDLLLIPMRPPQVEVAGRLIALTLPDLPTLIPEDTARIASDLLKNRPSAREKLHSEGACDISHFVPGLGRFRVSIFSQRGSIAIVMRVVPQEVPSLGSLGLPARLTEIAKLRSGLHLVTGPAGSGKTSTLAALVDRINEERPVQILTIENPIEFLHLHKEATVIQRELNRDVPSFAIALRAALRYSPRVIACSELRDEETFTLALEAAESGRVVLACLPTPNATRTLEYISGLYPPSEQQAIRMRLAKNLRWIISQRLIEKRDGAGRVAVFEIFKSIPRNRGILEKTDLSGKVLAYAMREGAAEGMQNFQDEIERLIQTGVISREAAVDSASDVLEDPIEPAAKSPLP
jgi:twitching motility protein PilT